MISFGKNITAGNDPLVKVPVDKIYAALRSPRSETLSLVRQLRIVRTMDIKRYGALKRSLPYMVGGAFNPSFRNKDNFAYTEYFFLDLDHLKEKGREVDEVRQVLQRDERVVLCFVSPSGDGLKLLFRLAERCHDAGAYSLFYRLFAQKFAAQHGIDQVVDTCTSDVSRACFVSADPDAYYNPGAARIDLSQYLRPDDSLQFFDTKHDVETAEREQRQAADPAPRPDVGGEVMKNILAILNPRQQARQEARNVFVPEQLNEIIEDLKSFIEKTGVVVSEIVNIQYGKKIRTHAGSRQAETNVFYGRRGFSVVMSPRSGTNGEFNEMMRQLIEAFFCGDPTGGPA